MVIPKLLILGLSRATGNRHYDIQLGLELIAQLAVLGLLLALIRRTPTLPGRERPLWSLLAAALLFWPSLVPWLQCPWHSTQYACVLVPGVAAVLVLHRHPQRTGSLLLAAPLVALAAASHGTGLFLALSIGLWLPFQGASRRHAAAWLACSIAFAAWMLWGLPERESVGLDPLGASLRAPATLLAFALRCFGAPPAPLLSGAALVAVGGVATAVLWRRGELGAYRGWILIGLWSVCVAAGSAVARSSMFAVPNPVYLAFFVLSWLSVTVLAAGALFSGPPGRLKRWGAATLLGVLGAAWLAGSYAGIAEARRNSRRVAWTAERLAYLPLLDLRDAGWIFPHPRIHTQILPELWRRGLLPPFADGRPFASSPDLGIRAVREGQSLLLVPEPRPEFGVLVLSALPGKPVERVEVAWDRGEGWRSETESHARRQRDGRAWILLHDAEPGRLRPVERLRLRFDAVEPYTPEELEEAVALYARSWSSQ